MSERLQHPQRRPSDVVWQHPIRPKLPKGKTKAEERLIAKVAKAVHDAYAEAIDGLHNAQCIAFKGSGGMAIPISTQVERQKFSPPTLAVTFLARGSLLARVSKQDERFGRRKG